jgi:hypothetical protein
MAITITIGWWLIPAINTALGFAWAWQPDFQDGKQNSGGMFSMPPTSVFATIPAVMWAMLNWLVYFIVF